MTSLMGHKTDRITIVRIALEHIEDLVQCYRQVYGEAKAWREFKKCFTCKQLWSIQEWAKHMSEAQKKGVYVERCVCGSDNVKDFWPTDEIKEYIFSETIKHKNEAGFVMLRDSVIIGFAWGYGESADEIESRKEIPGFIESMHNEFGEVVDQSQIFYQSELGVLEPYQKQGFGAMLFENRLNLAIEMGHSIGIFRTNPNAVSYHMSLKNGYKEILRYEIPGSNAGLTRVIMVADLQKVKRTIIARRSGDSVDYDCRD